MTALQECSKCSKMHFNVQDKGWRDWVFPQSNQQHGDAHRPGLVGLGKVTSPRIGLLCLREHPRAAGWGCGWS